MFNYWQRRYLGNKKSLNNFIQDSLDKNNVKYDSFFDLFAGTGSVGFNQLESGKDVSMNDFLYFNFVVFQGFSGSGRFSMRKLNEIEMELSSIVPGENNYFSDNFGGKYFSHDDSKIIGSIRERIELMKKDITKREYYILLASLLFSVDRIANTVGHYDAYRRVDLIDDKFSFELIKPFNVKTTNYNSDSNILAREIKSDLVYIDPPYNSRQYGDSYHLLENLAKWEKPNTFGLAAKMNRNHIKSEYSLSNAIVAFETLINSLNSKYIVVSYNDTGKYGSGRSAAKMSDEDILRILKARGNVTIEKKEYKAFNTGLTSRKKVYERLFICKVNKEPIYLQNLKSPLNYMGGKFSIIKELKENFPDNINNFYDIFAGGLNVGINSESNKVFANDKHKYLVEVLNYIKVTPTRKIIINIHKHIRKYKLSDTAKNGYEHYATNSSKGLASVNKESFMLLRKDFNKQKETSLLLTIVIFSFNNIMRFNGSDEFNAPVGKRDFNNNIRANLIAFSERLKDIVIEIKNSSFLELKNKKFKKDDFVFIDPPYFATNAVYNSKHWTIEDEKSLYAFIESLDRKNVKFMLTNATHGSRGENKELLEFINKNDFDIITTKNKFSNSSYNRKKIPSVEVIIKNY